MDYLTFYNNWNGKLTNEVFSTVRLRDDNRFILGKVFDDVWKVNKAEAVETKYGPHEIIMLKHLRLTDFTEYLALIDTGYPLSEFVKIIQTMYKNRTPVINWETQQLSVLLLKKVRRKEIQPELF